MQTKYNLVLGGVVAIAPHRILTIAGSDSGGGAGIQADLKTIAALGEHGLSVVTALTAQNSIGVHGVYVVPPRFVAAQLDAVLGDIGAEAVKIGMLAVRETVEIVTVKIADYKVPNLVLDPVLTSTGGRRLLEEGAEGVLVRQLFPLATIITPNLSEASAILGRDVSSESDTMEAARALFDMGPRAVLLKGGHLKEEARDLFWDGKEAEFLVAPRIYTPHTHGTGCVLSAAIATFLGKGLGLRESVRRAKKFITQAIRLAYPLGQGKGAVNPLGSGRQDG